MFHLVCCIICVLKIVNGACFCTSSLAAMHVPEVWFWPAKNGRNLKLLRCIHVLDMLPLKYCSDINEGFESRFSSFLCISEYRCFVYCKELFFYASGFGSTFSRIAVLWKRFQMDSKNDWTTKGWIFEFFCQKRPIFVNLSSAQSKSCKNCSYINHFDVMKSFR